MADANAQAKEQVKAGTEAKEKSVEEATKRLNAKPTPTQEENDLAKMGVPIETHEDDGSGPDPHDQHAKIKQAEPNRKPSGDYSTRSSGPSHSPAAAPKS